MQNQARGDSTNLSGLGSKHIPLLLLDRHQSAAVLGISARTFEELSGEPWMPLPIQLGQRLLRWSLIELQEAVTRMPRQTGKQQSVRDRIAKLKGEP